MIVILVSTRFEHDCTLPSPFLLFYFTLQTLAEFTEKFKIIKKDDKIISLKVSKSLFSKNDLNITFLDSLSILPASLAKLGKASEGELKGELDHTKSNKCSSYRDSPLALEAIRKELLNYNKKCPGTA